MSALQFQDRCAIMMVREHGNGAVIFCPRPSPNIQSTTAPSVRVLPAVFSQNRMASHLGVFVMPDKYGIPTLRDKYPIQCRKCKGLIVPDAYELSSRNEVIFTPGELMKTDGIGIDKHGVPVSLYVHLRCPENPVPFTRRANDIDHFFRVLPPSSRNGNTQRKQDFQPSPEAEIRKAPDRVSNNEVDTFLRAIRKDAKASEEASRRRMQLAQAAREPDIGDEVTVFFHTATPKEKPLVGEYDNTNNENAAIFQFGRVADKYGFRMIRFNNAYPDAVFESADGKELWVEFEHVSENFIKHGHDPRYCDLIVCYVHNCEKLTVPVLALRDLPEIP